MNHANAAGAPTRVVRVLTAVVAIISSAVLAACGGSDKSDTASTKEPDATAAASTGSPSTRGTSGKKVTFIIYAEPATPFFEPVVNGAKAAAKMYGLDLNIQYSNSDVATQNNQIQTAVANGTAGLAVSIPDNDAFTKSVCGAKAKAIPVVSFNVTATGGPVKDCLQSFVGQDFRAAGRLIAQRLITGGKLGQGAKVFCPVEQETAVYAKERAAGADDALRAIGAKCDVVGVGFDLGKARTAVEQYMLGHSDTKAILALGQVPLQVSPPAAKGIPVAGFDLSTDISKDIKQGKILATVGQQPYLQGFLSVQQLALGFAYGLTPSDVNTGNAIVDKSNVSNVAKLAGKVF